MPETTRAFPELMAVRGGPGGAEGGLRYPPEPAAMGPAPSECLQQCPALRCVRNRLGSSLIRVDENDGAFLLIEAAGFLPYWRVLRTG